MACALDPGPMTPAVGSIVANRFELVRELGRGAMGTVWLAEHLTLGVRCAVKFMSIEAKTDPEFSANYLARFELEARAIAQLGSTNVVRIIDYDTHEGVPFIAMECLQGEDLAARLSRVGRLDPASTYRIVSQVANGLVEGACRRHRAPRPEAGEHLPRPGRRRRGRQAARFRRREAHRPRGGRSAHERHPGRHARSAPPST